MFSFFGGLVDGILGSIISFVWFIVTVPFKLIGFAWSLIVGTVGLLLGLLLKPLLAIWFLFFPAASNDLSASSQLASKQANIVQINSAVNSKYTQASQTNHNPIKRSEYYKVRGVLSASEFVDEVVGEFGTVASSPFGIAVRGAANLTKGAIFVEDWLHTDQEIENRIKDVLSSRKLANASKYPESYRKFQEYVNLTLKKWIPDRDYPEIGYLPKDLLYAENLGEEKITKYWPEATKKDQERYTALTLDEVVLNYELIWEDLFKQS